MGEQFGTRVLLVEDEPVLQTLIAGYLVAGGYEVQTVSRWRASLRFAFSHLRLSYSGRSCGRWQTYAQAGSGDTGATART
jgi:hypothetical protein